MQLATHRIVECKSNSTSSAVVELGRLEYFGERALLKDDLRAVNVDCVSSVSCAKLTRDHFLSVLGPLQQLMETELTRRILRSIPILSHLNENERELVLSKFKEVQFAPKEQIIKRGDTGDTFYIVKEGAVGCSSNGLMYGLITD